MGIKIYGQSIKLHCIPMFYLNHNFLKQKERERMYNKEDREKEKRQKRDDKETKEKHRPQIPKNWRL